MSSVIWSGSLERAGLCAALSTYQGASSLGDVMIGEKDYVMRKRRKDLAPPRDATRLSTETVDQIWRLLRRGDMNFSQIAKQVGVSRWTVRRMCRRYEAEV